MRNKRAIYCKCHSKSSIATTNSHSRSLLLSTNPSRKPIPPRPKPPTLSSKLSTFLPFSKRLKTTSTSDLPEPPPASHAPLDLEDSLPYLQAFHPFTVTSTATLSPSSIASGSYKEEKLLTLISPDKLLRLELKLVVDMADETVDSLDLLRISPWADAELGSWVRPVCELGDVSTIGWATARYWKVNAVRAKIFARCRKRFLNLLSASEATANSSSEDETDRQTPASKGISRQLLHELLGRDSLTFSDGVVSLCITWNISFDWTGEAESHVSACAAYPQAWKEADQRASLGKVDEVFERLVTEKGVFEAIRIVVSLLFSPS